MFKNTTTIANTVRQPVGKAKPRDVVKVRGAEQLAHLDIIIKLAQAARTSVINDLDSAAISHFIDQIESYGEPASFIGVENDGEVLITFKRRSSHSPLNEDEVAVLSEANIPVGKEVLTPKLLAINPEYISDKKLMMDVKRALHGVVPKDFFVQQALTYKYVVTDKSLEKVFKKPTRELLEIVATRQFSSRLIIPTRDAVASITTKIANRIAATLKNVLLRKRSDK